MSRNQLKPNKNSKYLQGTINPLVCKKAILKNESIVYRSSYELKFIQWLESCEDIVRWQSEPFYIEYYLKGNKHKYYPDFYIEMKDGNKYLIEIKPKNQTIPPKGPHGKAWSIYTKNYHKWETAKKFCEERNIGFKIITEDTINNL